MIPSLECAPCSNSLGSKSRPRLACIWKLFSAQTKQIAMLVLNVDTLEPISVFFS